MWNLRAMDFELRQAWRKLNGGKVDCLWTSQLLVETGLSGELRAQGRYRGNTSGDGFLVGAEVVIRKIVSWVLGDEDWGRPQSEFEGGEAFDEYHRAAALWTTPKRTRRGSSFGAIQSAQHVLEMFRRTLPETAPPSVVLDRLVNASRKSPPNSASSPLNKSGQRLATA